MMPTLRHTAALLLAAAVALPACQKETPKKVEAPVPERWSFHAFLYRVEKDGSGNERAVDLRYQRGECGRDKEGYPADAQHGCMVRFVDGSLHGDPSGYLAFGFSLLPVGHPDRGHGDWLLATVVPGTMAKANHYVVWDPIPNAVRKDSSGEEFRAEVRYGSMAIKAAAKDAPIGDTVLEHVRNGGGLSASIKARFRDGSAPDQESRLTIIRVKGAS